MENEELIKKRFIELANKAFHNNIYTTTNFHNPAELTLLEHCSREEGIFSYQVFGGNDFCERQVVCFGNEKEIGYAPEFPITLLTISPIHSKFSDSFTHRDFLGALINLGIERNTIGDIFIKNNIGYLYCLTKIADYITEHLTKVKHTNVRCEIAKTVPAELTQDVEEVKFSVASERIDAVIAAITKLSRSKTIELFRTKKVFINSKIIEHNDYKLEKGDILSIRGYGKFIYDGIITTSKKGKLVIIIKKLV